MIAFAKEPESNDEPPGGGGNLFTRSDNLRSDARLAARMISLGVIPLDEAEELLKAGFRLAMTSAQSDDPRGYAACMKIAIEVAKLAQTEQHKVLDKVLPDLHAQVEARATVPELLVNPEYLEWLRERERSSDPRLICQNGHQGDGKPLDDGSARNGH